METQQQSTLQGWQVVNKEPFMAVNEAASPTSTYVSMGDGCGVPTPGAREGGTMSPNTGLRPAQYEEIRAGQAEGLGLLQDVVRPVAWRKEIRRKSVPGQGNESGSP